MRFTVQESSDSDLDGEGQSVHPRRIRSRYVLFVALAASLVTIRLGSDLVRFGRSTAELAWDYPLWTLLPLVAFAAGLAALLYIEACDLFADFSDWPMILAVPLGIAVSVFVALEFETQLDPISQAVGSVPGGWVTVSTGFVVLAVVTLLLRRLDVESVYFDLDDGALIAGAIVLLGAGYLAIRAAVEFIAWGSVSLSAVRFSRDYWPAVVAVTLILVQIPFWRRRLPNKNDEARHYGRDRTQPDLPSERPQSLLGSVAMGGGSLLVILGVLLYYIPDAIVIDGLSPAQRAAAITDERRTILAIVAGLGAALTLLYTALRHQLERDANATGRYTDAVQQLGNESMSIRLGGVYALARVSRDSPADRTAVSEVLASFVRDGSRSLSSTGVSLDVMAALTSLAQVASREATSVNLRASKLVAGNLDAVRFPTGVDLRHSELTSTNLSESFLAEADLSFTDLTQAILSKANLRGSRLAGAAAARAEFIEADLTLADLSDADFSNARMHGASLIGANLVGVSLKGAGLSDANLSGADLSGVDLTSVNLNGARVEATFFHGTGLGLNELAAFKVSGEPIFETSESDAGWKAHRDWERENEHELRWRDYD